MFLLYQTVLLYGGCVFISLVFGFILSVIVPSGQICRQITGFAMEFSSGFTVAVVFLSLIPSAYHHCGPFEIAVFLILGISFSMLLQEKLKYRYRTMSERLRLSATERLFVLSFTVCGIIKGLSVGMGYGLSSGLGLGLGVSSAISLFPDGTAIFLMRRSSGRSNLMSSLFCFLLVLPFVFGLFLGLYLGRADTLLLFRMLLFAGGVTLYSAVGDMSIESKLLYRGRFIPVFNVAGMIIGSVLVLAG